MFSPRLRLRVVQAQRGECSTAHDGQKGEVFGDRFDGQVIALCIGLAIQSASDRNLKFGLKDGGRKRVIECAYFHSEL